MWNHKEIRKTFIDFFVERDHKYVKSSSLIPRDPSLLFTIAGMVQFKPYWAGVVEPPFRRATSVQKCLRVNDLENVGRTIRHNTFFEMLGNFSFGDYFKREAILWAWELLTEVYRVDVERLSVTVFHEDEEAYRVWKDEVGIPEDRIYRLDERTNFWGPAGGVGACGPSTEIFYDMGESFECEREDCGPDCDCDRFIEVWNIVFPQYNQLPDGRREPLKNRGIDTGMGMERLSMVLQGKDTIFKTDLFYPIVSLTEDISGARYEENPVSFNVIADHVRALVFAISDGVIPSNEERGYVLRRVLRRALRFGEQIGLREPFLYRLVGVVVDIMGDVYPEIKEKPDFVSMVIKSEEERFLKTLSSGLVMIDELMDKHKEDRRVTGSEAFKLYDTYGFPFEMTKEILKERGYEVDEEGFKRLLEERKRESREAQKFKADVMDFNVYKKVEQKFVGYDNLEVETDIIMWRRKDGKVEVVLEYTPFYAESGGQIGDRGMIEGKGFRVDVEDTYYNGPYRVCYGTLKGEIEPGKVFAKVDVKRRRETERAHTATHILHSALRKIVGEYARQQGSLVEPGRLRFDFNSYSSVKDRVEDIEGFVYDVVLRNLPVETFHTTLDKAMKMGAMALFEEEYGERVRVVRIGDVSMELCGGTHLRHTGEIGLFKIANETGVAAGIRRIEAYVGLKAMEYLREREKVLLNISHSLQVSPDKVDRKVLDLMDEIEHLKEKTELVSRELRDIYFERVKEGMEKVGSYNFYSLSTHVLDLTYLREISDMVRGGDDRAVGFFVHINEGIRYIIFSSKGTGVDVREVSRLISKDIGGGGGGREDFVQGGGKNKEGWKTALERIRSYLMTH